MTKSRTSELPRAAVVGAGRMGHGIALELARGGYEVSIYDVQKGRARQAITEAEQDAADLISAGVIEAADVETIVARLEAVTSIQAAVDGVDVVFEAVAEDLDIKREVFAQLDQYARVDTLLLSNTSSIGITEIAVSCRCPERVALAHWILPPHLIPVVEVAPGEQTNTVSLSSKNSTIFEGIDVRKKILLEVFDLLIRLRVFASQYYNQPCLLL